MFPCRGRGRWRRWLQSLMLCCTVTVGVQLLMALSVQEGRLHHRFPVWGRHIESAAAITAPPLRWSPIHVDRHRSFVISAIVDLRHPQPGIHQVVLTAWDMSIPRNFRCCFTIQDDGIEDVPATYVTHFRLGWYRPTYFRCNVSAALSPRVVSFADTSCKVNRSASLSVVYPERRPGEVAICTKVAFGRLDPQSLYEWFEIQQLLGVTRFVTFIYPDVEDGAMRVFEFYRSRGLLTIVPFLEPGNPARHIGHQSGFQYHGDTTIPNFDCLIRLSGFSFVTIMDFDEILVPNANNSWSMHLPTFFKKLNRLHPNVAGFTFLVKLFILNWTEDVLHSPLFHMRHVLRTDPMVDRIKYFFMPGRVAQCETHHIRPVAPYKRLMAPVDVASLHHYRKCRPEWKAKCMTKFQRHRDDSLLALEKQLMRRLRALQELNPPEPLTV